MALFKILKGLSTNLMDQNSPTKKANEGWAYFTTNDGKFYIDIAGNGTQDAVIGTNRICLNAATADNVGHNFVFRVNSGTSEENGNQITYNGSEAKTINLLNGTGITISANATNKGNITITNTGVVGAKGNAENSYRTGQVNITGANIIGSSAIGSSTKPVYWTGSTFSAISSYEGNSATATKATQDGSGNNIVNTYLTKAAGVTAVSWDSSNKKITRTINGTAADVVQFVAGSNVTLTGASGKITIAATDTVYTHPTYTAVSAAAVKVGRDSTGHVVIGSAITASDVGASSVTIRRWTA